MKLSIIYVNYNTQNLLIDSLASLKKNYNARDHELIIVDNNSDDFDEKAVSRIFPKAKLIKSTENLGFGKANNLAAKQAKGEFLWLLNTDTIVPVNNNLNIVVDFLDTHPSYGAASPQLILGSGQPQATQVGHFPSIFRQIMQKFLPGSAFGMHYLPSEATDVDCMAAAAIFIRKSSFDKVKGFTPEYFMYFEDTDLWQKFKRAGLKVRFMPGAEVTHLESQSIKDKGKLKQVYFASQDAYYRRWKSTPSRMMLKAIRLVTNAKRPEAPRVDQ